MASADPDISAFSVEQASRLTGLTRRQLQSWDAAGVLSPMYAEPTEGGRPVRAYSFGDVVALRILYVLRQQHGISVQKLRDVARRLVAASKRPWATLKLSVRDGEVIFNAAKSGRARGDVGGAYVPVPLMDQVRHVEREAALLNRREPKQIGKFEQSRTVARNARVIAGTRIPVRTIERFLAAGYSPDAILAEYPSLRAGDIAAVAHARPRPKAAA